MESVHLSSSIQIVGRIEAFVYDADYLNQSYTNWNEKSDGEKLSLIENEDPIDHQEVYNVTTDRYHEYLVDDLDPDQTAAKDNVYASWVAVGTDGPSGTSTVDTDLNTRVFSKQVTDHADNGKELLASTFIDSTEANGETLNEIGLFTGNPDNLGNAEVFMINHANFSDVIKDDSKSVTFNVELTFADT